VQPLRIHIDRIVDFGTVVSLVGVDAETSEPVAIHIDYRAFAAFRATLQQTGSAPIEYAAQRLILHLDMLPADNTTGVLLIEHERPPVGPANDEPCAVPEVSQ
jgi:hypothetical protein